MTLANQYAQRYGHDFITSRHLLIALLMTDGVAAAVLAKLIENVDELREEIDRSFKGNVPSMAGPEGTPMAKAVIDFATKEMADLNHNYIGTEHLLLGFARYEESIGTGRLIERGHDYGVIREKLDDLYGGHCSNVPNDNNS